MDQQNAQNSSNAVSKHPDTLATDFSARAADQADKAISATMRATDNAAQSLHDGLKSLQEKAPGLLTQAGATADELIAQGVERAREASRTMRETTGLAQDRATVYIREKPLNAVLIAAGVGAVLALLLSSGSRR